MRLLPLFLRSIHILRFLGRIKWTRRYYFLFQEHFDIYSYLHLFPTVIQIVHQSTRKLLH